MYAKARFFHLFLFSDVSESQSDLTGVSDNFVTDTLSPGITFRDPETGVLYVQTQLLQVRFLFSCTPDRVFHIFTRFNKAYLLNLYKIKLVDPWVR